MGLEQKTQARQGRKKYDGKLYLDSKSVSFRGKEFRWEATLGPAVVATSVKDRLRIQTDDGEISFEIGAKVSSWVDKINNPPTRVTKLGVKQGQKFWVSKGFQKPFLDEMRSAGASLTRKLNQCEIAFWKVTHREQLKEFKKLAAQIPDRVNLWIVWTKGSDAISQTEVMDKAKACGWGPSKTAAFDDEHSSMRYSKKRV